MAIDFKTTGLREFEQALSKYEAASSKTRDEVLEHRARNLAFALHAASARVARATKKRIMKTPANRMRVRGGDKRSKRQEKARRMFAAGFVAAGYIPAIRSLKSFGSVNTVADVGNPKGGVRRGKDYIEIYNAQPGAVEAEKKWDIEAKALRGQVRDMERYMARKMRKDAERFGG